MRLTCGKSFPVRRALKLPHERLTPKLHAFSFGGGRLDPIVGANYEIRMKGELRDGALSAAIAVYFITKENVAQRDPRHPGLTDCNNTVCSIDAGKQQSKGVDMELNGAPPRGRRRRMTALNASNLFDKNYYTRLDQLSQGNMYGEPASVMLSLDARF